MIERDAISRSPSSSSASSPIRTAIAHRIGAVAEQQEIAVGERDLPARGRVDGNALAVALDRRAVGRAQVAEHVVVADQRDLRVIAGQVKVADHDRARRGRGRSTRSSRAVDAVHALLRACPAGSRERSRGKQAPEAPLRVYTAPSIFAHVGTLESHRAGSRSAGGSPAPARLRARGRARAVVPAFPADPAALDLATTEPGLIMVGGGEAGLELVRAARTRLDATPTCRSCSPARGVTATRRSRRRARTR